MTSGTQVFDKDAAIRAADEFSMQDVIERYSHDHDVPMPLAIRHARELKRFLALCAINPNAKYGMRGEVDDLWHVFMFFSLDYTDFCEKVAGHYIHHVPEKRGAFTAEDRAASQSSYELMLADYEAIFKEAPPADIWPRLGANTNKAAGDACGSSCGRSCNTCSRGCGSSCGAGCQHSGCGSHCRG